MGSICLCCAAKVSAEIKIQTVPCKSHVLFRQSQAHLIPASANPQIMLHNDGFKLLGSEVANDNFLASFLHEQWQQSEQTLVKLSKFDLKAKYNDSHFQ